MMVFKETTESLADRRDDKTAKDRLRRRRDLACRLFFFGDGDFEGEGSVLDVSTTGCRATFSIDLKPGRLLKLSLFLPDHPWPLRVDQAVVRWAKGQEFGVEFTSLRLGQRERLRALLMKAKF